MSRERDGFIKVLRRSWAKPKIVLRPNDLLI